MKVVTLFLILAAIALVIMLIWNIIDSVVLYRDVKRTEQKLRDELYMETLRKTKTSVPLFELTDDQRIWLAKVTKKIPNQHDIFIWRILNRGYYTPDEKKELNNIRNEYMELIKIEKNGQAELNKLLNEL